MKIRLVFQIFNQRPLQIMLFKGGGGNSYMPLNSSESFRLYVFDNDLLSIILNIFSNLRKKFIFNTGLRTQD